MIKTYFKKAMSVLLCALIIVTALPITTMAATPKGVTAVTDNGTAHTFEDIMGTDIDGNRYAGRVWVDKSVYTDGQTAVLNTSGDEGSTFTVNLEDGESFQTVFSALGSSMTTQTTVSSSGPLDVVIIMDVSTSMRYTVGNSTVSRLQKLIESSNKLLEDLTESNDIRIGIAAYNHNSIEILPFGRYENGVQLSVVDNKYTYPEGANNSSYGVIRAKDNDGKVLHNNNKGYASGTNVQAGIDKGMSMLKNATDTTGRTPVVILLTDGAANTAVTKSFYNLGNQEPVNVFKRDDTNHKIAPGVALATLLNAAFNRAVVEDHYGKAPTIYGIGVDLDGNAAANAIINPGDTENGFNSNNISADIRTTYNHYVNTWLQGKNVNTTDNNDYGGSHKFTIDHGYKNTTNITTEDIAANINYVDKYYNVTSEELEDTFTSIYEELFSGAFNPITSTQTVDGATGVQGTPLIYVDHIGEYMEVKNIQAVTLFGNSYAVTNNNGAYTVEYAKGVNPTTNEEYETSDDIKIEILENADGTQKLQISINQEILPILLEQVSSKTVGNDTTATINELTYGPLRVYYTVGIKSDVLLPNGEVDLRKIDKAYAGLDLAEGTLTLYSNQFGVADESGTAVSRDAHVGFKPAAENRYYYHQSNQGIFTEVTYKSNGNNVDFPDDHEYGIPWNDKDYNLHWMTYADYLATGDDEQVYTYVSYYRPTESATDNINAAEKVTYLVYTDWKYLKPSAAFYDAKTEKYVNYDAVNGYTLDDIGRAMTAGQIAEYVTANPSAEIYAVLGVGSKRTSRFHNMTFAKEVNRTETDPIRYEPQYTEGTAAQHHGNDVVVWLGNNGRLTLPLSTGIALSKAANEEIGNPDDTYTLTLKIDDMPLGEAAAPVVHDINGNDFPFTFENDTVKVSLKVGETVYVSGIPAGSECTVGEEIPANAKYRVDSISSKNVTIPTVEEVMNGAKAQYEAVTVTNTLNKFANLNIAKEIKSDHAVPDSVLNQKFAFELDGGAELANKSFGAEDSLGLITSVAFDANGKATVNVSARQRIKILQIPENTVITLTEKLTAEQAEIFTDVLYRARNHSGENPTETATPATVTVPSDGNATVVVTNTYLPKATTVALDLEITKSFADESVKNKLQGGEFNFLVEKYDTTLATPDWVKTGEASVQYQAEEYGEKKVSLDDILKNEHYTATGTYSYRIYEVKGSSPNVSYDRTIHTFDVVVTDNAGQLVARVVDEHGNEINASHSVAFNNTYDTAPVSMDIKKEINNLSGDGDVSALGFEFRAFSSDANGNKLSDTPENVILSDAAGEARLSGVYTRSQIGTHYYLVVENNDAKKGWIYSNAQYLVTVVVAVDDASGRLAANMSIAPLNDAARAEKAPTVTDNNKGQLYFTNTYAPKAATLNIDPLVKKNLEGKALKAGDFTFELYENGKATAILRGTNDADGNLDFKAVDANNPLTANDLLNFNKVGKYEFDIKEVKGNAGGIIYDETIYDLVVEVINDTATGELTAVYYFEDSTDTFVTFKNYYKLTPTTYKFAGTKTLTGRPMQSGEFEFGLYENNLLGNPIEVVENHLNGSFEFSEITYTAAGVYKYAIAEILPTGVSYNPQTNKFSLNGITYDTHQENVTVTVVDNGDGTLTATSDIENANIIFANTYKAAPATVTFKGNKEFKGGTLAAGDFAFRLYQTDHNLDISANGSVLKETKTNDANGEIAFTTISYTEAGTYFYVIDEDETYNTKEEVVYDTTKHGYRVQVRDYGTGTLVATVINMDTGATEADNANVEFSFVNATFEEATEKEVARQENAVAKIDGELVSAGEVLTYYIYYYNYTGGEVTVEISDTIPAHTSYVEGSASHDGVYAGGNIDWILTVPRGKSVMVQFSVKVDEEDSIVANTAIVRDGTNTYSTNTVNNHTYKEPVKKEVFSPDDVDLSIDGKKVYSGDTLLYTISYTNTSYDVVDLEIVDEIPENTTYVDGSASNGGVYQNGEIVWEIEDVQPWTTVTVAFMVTVDENIGAKVITNKAIVEDGKNSYTTNEVKNHTVEDEVGKKVYQNGDLNANIDGKKVYSGDTLVYEISYKNTDTEAATVTITDAIPQHTTYVEGSASNGGSFANGEIVWSLEVPAGETVTVSFKVTVNKVQTVEITNSAKIAEGKNSYTTNTVVNRTTVDKVEKTVASMQNLGINIDGKKVYEGDTLLYRINYKNNDSEAATVTITDTVPEYTTYVEGSADNGGTFAEGKITWNVTVPANDDLTVSFKVKVEENIGKVDIENTANAVEGRNSYTTNTVVNHTVIDEVEKDVFLATEPTVSIDGEKVYEGDELVYEISYKNTDTAEAMVEITDTVPEYTTYVEGSADNGGTFAEGKITWNVTIPAGETVKVSFKVKVEENIGKADIENVAQIKEGNNTYTTNKVVNYTVVDEVEKDVFLADIPTVSVDGKEVKAGDELIYSISYTNNFTKVATVTITDAIPQHTTYVEGSADNNGVYSDGLISWTMEVPAGETITVSFKVKVNEDAEGVTLSNIATVVEGKNEYITNEIVNTTELPEEEIPENPENPEKPQENPTDEKDQTSEDEANKENTPNNPKTGDYINFTMLIAVAFVSGGILLWSAFSGKKSKNNCPF